MPLSLDDLTAISHAVAQEEHPGIEIIGITSVDGGTDRVELMVMVPDRNNEARQVVLNCERTNRKAFAASLRSKLADARNAS